MRESAHTADLTACPTSVPGCQDRALPVQRPDSPSASSNCLSGTLPTFLSNDLTPPPSLLSAGGRLFCFVELQFSEKGGWCQCTVSAFWAWLHRRHVGLSGPPLTFRQQTL